MICLVSQQKLKNLCLNVYFETLSQLGDCKKQLVAFKWVLSEAALAVKCFEEELAIFKTGLPSFPEPGTNHPCMYADAVTRTLDEREYDRKAEETIVLFIIPESFTPREDSNVNFLWTCKLLL